MEIAEPCGPLEELQKQQQQQTDAVEQVFAIDLLLETILACLDTPDLKTCRIVNFTWNLKSTRILLNRKTLSINFRFKDETLIAPSLTHRSLCLPDHDEHKINALIKILKINHELDLPFPSAKYSFHNCDLWNPDLQQLLSSFGHQIQNILFDFGDSRSKKISPSEFMEHFKYLILEQINEIEILRLGGHHSNFWESNRDHNFKPSETRNDDSILPNLKHLIVSSTVHKKVFQYVLEIGGNIQKVDLRGHEFQTLLGVLLKMNKAHLLTSLVVNLKPGYFEIMEKFSLVKNLQLERLLLIQKRRLPENSDENLIYESKVVLKLLKSVAQSLESLHTPPLTFYPNFEIPALPKLKSLTLFCPESNCSKNQFPKEFKMSKLFPNLAEFQSLFRFSPSMIENVFKDNLLGASYEDTVLSLRSILFESGPSSICIETLPSMYPNLVDVSVGTLKNSNISANIRALFSLKNLESLNFGIEVPRVEELQGGNDFGEDDLYDPLLEAALTGFSEEDCTNVWNGRSRKFEGEKMNTSLLDCKSLRRLGLRIEDNGGSEPKVKNVRILSHLTGLYAFGLCPQVKVSIGLFARNKRNLEILHKQVEPIKSFVDQITETKGPGPSFLPLPK